MSGPESQHSLADDELEVKLRTVNGVHAVLVAVGLFGLPFALNREPASGLVLEQAAAMAFAGFMLISWFLRYQLNLHTRFILIVSLLGISGAAGLIQYGMLGAAPFWLIVCAMFTGIVISPRAGLIASGLVCALVALVGIGFVTGLLELGFAPDKYVFTASAWANYLVSGLVLTLLLVHIISSVLVRVTHELLESREALKAAAHYDELTGAVRPHLLKEILNMELLQRPRDGGHLALLYLDLDRFKAINDEYGHAAGDVVLKELVNRIRRTLRGEDAVARLGGDEFAVLLRKIDAPETAATVASKIRKAVLMPVEYRNLEIDFGVSIGIAIAPRDASDVDNLLRKADQAMYLAKRRGSNQIAMATSIIEPTASVEEIDVLKHKKKELNFSR